MPESVTTALIELMDLLNHQLNVVVGDFIVSERVTPEKYLSLLDEGTFEWNHPDEPWSIEFTSTHMVKAVYRPDIPDTYKWYSVLNRMIVLDISEMLEDQVGA